MKTRALFLVLILALVGAAAFAQDTPPVAINVTVNVNVDGVKAPPAAPEPRLAPGQIVRFIDGATIASTRDYISGLFTALHIGDSEGITEIFDTGEAGFLMGEPTARVLSVEGEYVRVRILEGDFAGQIIWAGEWMAMPVPRG